MLFVVCYFQGPAFWYTYPESPLGPSASKNMMLKHQARHTAIAEFFNNVAHSHKNVSMYFKFFWILELLHRVVLFPHFIICIGDDITGRCHFKVNKFLMIKMCNLIG